MRLAVKLKLVTDTYVLQSKRSLFNGSNNESTKCLLCEEEPETKKHFILKCRILTSIRKSILNEIDSLCLVHYRKSFYDLEVYVQTQLVLDSSKAHKLISINFCGKLNIRAIGCATCYTEHDKDCWRASVLKGV